MKKDEIQKLFSQFENACYEYKGIECWSARELQIIFNYAEWRNFLKVIDKAKEACQGSGNIVSDHFVEINKMVEDSALTLSAASLTALSFSSSRLGKF